MSDSEIDSDLNISQYDQEDDLNVFVVVLQLQKYLQQGQRQKNAVALVATASCKNKGGDSNGQAGIQNTNAGRSAFERTEYSFFCVRIYFFTS